ncbi:glycosyltransferase [Bacillus sp. 03113]|uniref:glycosyltransferase family 2 protein n=1 Tax=Bacillus sp. 03113 TaxID=2578211 RepID=UPI0015E89CFC|nr:glycosyltransferase [Bacillus sp. 03113]
MSSISVVIPTYNRAHLIKESIQSVLDQTMAPLEIIIVDDFSTDHTREVVESFQHKNVKYVLNSRAKGANGARNTGILLAQGDYIAFQDSDDIWKDDKLEKQMKIFEQYPDIGMCFCSLHLSNRVRRIVPRRKVESAEIEDQLKIANFISTQTVFIRTEIAKRILFDENLKRFQDWDFCLRVSKHYRIYHLDEPLAIAKVQADSISNNVNEIGALQKIFTKHPELKQSALVNKYLYNKVLFYQKKNKGFQQLTYFLKYFIYMYIDKIFLRGQKL